MGKMFGDNAGRRWTLELNVGAIKRVRTLCGVDLLEIATGSGLAERLSNDPVLLCDAIYAAIKPEADKAGVTDEEFGRAMAGDAIADAAQAFLDELVAFFPRGRRDLLRRAVEGMRGIEAEGMELAGHKLEQILDEARSQLHGSGVSSTSSPEP
jgi:hypothetical protein